MFIEPGAQGSLKLRKLRRSDTLRLVEKAHCAPLELKKSFRDLSYKHLAALRPEPIPQRNNQRPPKTWPHKS